MYYLHLFSFGGFLRFLKSLSTGKRIWTFRERLLYTCVRLQICRNLISVVTSVSAYASGLLSDCSSHQAHVAWLDRADIVSKVKVYTTAVKTRFPLWFAGWDKQCHRSSRFFWTINRGSTGTYDLLMRDRIKNSRVTFTEEIEISCQAKNHGTK
jgi:hypothetical protein